MLSHGGRYKKNVVDNLWDFSIPTFHVVFFRINVLTMT